MCNPVITNTIFGIDVASFKRPATPSEVAGLFCALTDDQMAEFFVAVKKIADTWERSPVSFTGAQWWFTGGHLAECPGAQETDTIEIFREIVRGYEARQRKLELAPMQ